MAVLPVQGKWLPGGAMAALAESRALNGIAFLTPLQGGLLLAAYAVVTLAVSLFSVDPMGSFGRDKQLLLFLVVPVVYTLGRGRRAASYLCRTAQEHDRHGDDARAV